MTEWLERAVEGAYPELFEVFADLHRHPEVGFAEHRTTARVAELLQAAGYTVRTSTSVTGAVGVLAGGPGPIIALRADIDALPIAERTGLPYSSESVPREDSPAGAPAMHACGHDLHTTSLIGTARLLAAHRHRWSGTVIVLAQPAEELGEGARRFIGSGVLDGLPVPGVVIGQHVGRLNDDGLFGSRAGAYEAGQRNWRVTVRGPGGHAAGPHRVRNPLAFVSQLVLRAQAIVGTSTEAGERAVLVPTTVHGGAGSNVIPAEASATFCARGFSDEVLDTLEVELERLVHGLAVVEGFADGVAGAVEIERFGVFPLNINDPDALARTVATLEAEFGPDAYRESPGILGSEDFGEFATHWGVPSAYWHFDGGVAPGAPDADAARRGHSPTFAPDPEVALRRGIRALTAVALEFLGPGPREGGARPAEA